MGIVLQGCAFERVGFGEQFLQVLAAIVEVNLIAAVMQDKEVWQSVIIVVCIENLLRLGLQAEG